MLLHDLLRMPAICLIVAGCATAGRVLETPAAPRPADHVGPFEILGVISRSTCTLNRANAHTVFDETVNVNVPPGTELIVPAMRGWVAGFGKIDPNDCTSNSVEWGYVDHHFGFALLNVGVERINTTDTSTTPPTQTAMIRVQAHLTDDNGDDRWFGYINYTLICLGRRQVAPLGIP